MKDVKIRISADTADAKKGIDDVTKSTKNLKGSTNELTGSLDKMTGGAVTGLKKFATGLKAIAGGFRTIGGAIAASGIGLIVITIAALTAAFRGSEEGQNKFAKIMGVIGAVTGNLVDLLADLGEKIISVFENPKQAVKDFANLIKTNITNRFDGLMELVPALGTALGQLFSGEFSKAAETAGNAVAKVTLGVDDLSGKIKAVTDATKDFIDQNVKEGNAAAKVADQRAKADKIERGLLVRRAKAEREIAELRLKAKDLNNVSAEERQAALLKVLDIQDGLAVSEVEIAQLRSDAQTAENTFARSTKENLLEEERLKAAVIAVETKRIDQKRTIQRELTAAENELNAKVKAEAAAKTAKQKEDDKKEEEAAKAKIERLNKLEDSRAKAQQDRYAKELADKKAFEDAKRAMEDQSLANTKAGIGILTSLAGESKALKAVSLIAENASTIAGITINASRSIADRTASHNAIPHMIGAFPNPAKIADGIGMVKDIAGTKLSAGIGIATSGVALAKGLAALGQSGGGGSAPSLGGGESGGASAPSFNLVEGTESNAIQDSITNQGNAPIKAFVTSGDITKAQQLDRQAEVNSGF
mgnify:CR=1 FL=1|tara:strand:+ start:5418 stop:7187 length:1770 start_codon:yes stop_codon:yes gene_type:complete